MAALRPSRSFRAKNCFSESRHSIPMLQKGVRTNQRSSSTRTVQDSISGLKNKRVSLAPPSHRRCFRDRVARRQEAKKGKGEPLFEARNWDVSMFATSSARRQLRCKQPKLANQMRESQPKSTVLPVSRLDCSLAFFQRPAKGFEDRSRKWSRVFFQCERIYRFAR